MLTLPRVKFYAYFVREQNDNKTPSYVMTKRFGEYEPIEYLKPSRGKYRGKVRFYLNAHDKRTSNLKESTPPMFLQGIKSFNFTGLKHLYEGGKLSGVAYGYPSEQNTYGAVEAHKNPFFENKEDCFLFKVYQDGQQTDASGKIIPCSFELIVLDGCKQMGADFCKVLKMGGYDDVLKDLRTKVVDV